jgi:type IV secretory pathway VirB2 component (pilin)
MWDQYKRSFAKTQAVIVVVTVGTYVYLGHGAARSAVFFLVMQVGAVLGAMWGTRLKKKVDRQTGLLI